MKVLKFIIPSSNLVLNLKNHPNLILRGTIYNASCHLFIDIALGHPTRYSQWGPPVGKFLKNLLERSKYVSSNLGNYSKIYNYLYL